MLLDNIILSADNMILFYFKSWYHDVMFLADDKFRGEFKFKRDYVNKTIMVIVGEKFISYDFFTSHRR
jgi:hypothetical protein